MPFIPGKEYLSALSYLILLFLPATTIASDWYLMARHGECAEIDALKRKIPDLEGMTTPKEFSSFMTNKGHTVELHEMDGTEGGIVNVKIEKMSLDLLFAKRERCKEFLDNR